MLEPIFFGIWNKSCDSSESYDPHIQDKILQPWSEWQDHEPRSWHKVWTKGYLQDKDARISIKDWKIIQQEYQNKEILDRTSC